MKRLKRYGLALLWILIGGFALLADGQPAPAALSSEWTGTLYLGAGQLDLILQTDDTLADGQPVAMISPSQSPDAIPGTVTVDGERYIFRFPTIGGEFVARLRGDLLFGTWSQNGNTMGFFVEKRPK